MCFFAAISRNSRDELNFPKTPETTTPHQLESPGSSLSSFPGHHLAIFFSNPARLAPILPFFGATNRVETKAPETAAPHQLGGHLSFLQLALSTSCASCIESALGERPGFNFIFWPAQVGIAHCIVATEQTGSTCLLSSVGRACAS